MSNQNELRRRNKHRITAICPKCGKEYTGYPAVSREDNLTKICTECGIREALMDADVKEEEQEEIILEIRKTMVNI